MLKVIGIGMILLGSTGFGVAMAGDLEKRIRELQELLQLMLLLKGEIRYMHQPLPEVFLHLSNTAKHPFKEFFFQTAQDLQRRDGRTAGQVWRKNRSSYLYELHLSRQELQDLDGLGSILGYLDVDMQLDTLDYYIEQLRQSVDRASEVSKDRRRLYQYLGILSGLALVIIII